MLFTVHADDDGPFSVIPSEHVDDPARIRESLRRLVEPALEVVCPAHGAPLASGGGAGLLEAVQSGSN